MNKIFTFVSQNLPFLISVSDNRVDRTFSPGFKVLVIYQTRETVRFHQDIEKPRRELKYDAQWSIFDDIRGVWIANETLSRV